MKDVTKMTILMVLKPEPAAEQLWKQHAIFYINVWGPLNWMRLRTHSHRTGVLCN